MVRERRLLSVLVGAVLLSVGGLAVCIHELQPDQEDDRLLRPTMERHQPPIGTQVTAAAEQVATTIGPQDTHSMAVGVSLPLESPVRRIELGPTGDGCRGLVVRELNGSTLKEARIAVLLSEEGRDESVVVDRASLGDDGRFIFPRHYCEVTGARLRITWWERRSYDGGHVRGMMGTGYSVTGEYAVVCGGQYRIDTGWGFSLRVTGADGRALARAMAKSGGFVLGVTDISGDMIVLDLLGRTEVELRISSKGHVEKTIVVPRPTIAQPLPLISVQLAALHQH